MKRAYESHQMISRLSKLLDELTQEASTSKTEFQDMIMGAANDLMSQFIKENEEEKFLASDECSKLLSSIF